MTEKNTKNRDVAEQMMGYLTKRAEVERVPFELSLEEFQKLCQMTYHMFGVEHDGKELISDRQEPYPGFFEEHKRSVSGKSKKVSHHGHDEQMTEKFIHTDGGKVNAMDRDDVIDELVEMKASELEDELSDEIDCFIFDLNEMDNDELAESYLDYMGGEMRVEVRKTEE